MEAKAGTLESGRISKLLPTQGDGTVLPDAWSRRKEEKIFLLYFWAK